MANDFTVVTALADAGLGVNLLQNQEFNKKGYARWITRIGVCGSTNPADFAFDLMVGGTKKGTFYNTSGGANLVPDDTDLKYVQLFVPANAEIQAIVIDAPAGNPVAISYKFDVKKRRAFTRSTGSRVIRNPAAYAAAVARNRGSFRRY